MASHKPGAGPTSNRRYLPYSLVWTPIPVVTALLPFIGHLGVCRSDGVTYDFAGHCTVNVDNFAFGQPTRSVQLQPEKAVALRDQVNQSIRNGSSKTLAAVWDDWLSFSRSIYSGRMYGFFTDNCHQFVAHFLNSIKYEQSKDWSAGQLALLMFWGGQYLGWTAIAKQWLPFALVMGLGWHFGGVHFLLGWLALAIAAMAWFWIYATCILSRNNRILSI